MEMKDILQRLTEHQTLSRSEAKEALYAISTGEVNASHMAAFMSVYLMRPITIDELAGFKDTLQELCLRIDLSDFNTIDLCGTGGDGKHTFNISTLASFVVAGAGEKVAKHGNYGVSSSCGSSNVMEFLGYKFTNDAGVLRRQIDKANICFFHAPLFHPAMKTVAPIRRELGLKTFFNMLGPLINPSAPQNQLAGVFSLETLRMYTYMLQQTNVNYTVIHSLDGYDEISLTGPFKAASNLTDEMIQPEDIGLRQLAEEELAGGNSVAESAKIFVDILEGKGTEAQNNVVLVNAAMALKCIRQGTALDQNMEAAKKSLFDGKALDAFKKLVS